MSSTRDSISLYNNSQYNLLSHEQMISYSNIGVDNTHISFDTNIDNFLLLDDQGVKNKICDNFKWLELELLKNQRSISAFDFYKIEGSFDTSAISTSDLLKNHSLICTYPTIINEEQYVAGDLLYKQNNGQIQKIELGLSGLYVPTVDNSKENLQIEWKWNLAKPKKDLDPITLTFAENNYYGEIKDRPTSGWSDIEKNIEAIMYTKNDEKYTVNITPVVKGYHLNNNENSQFYEEVFWDFTVTLEGSNWKISNIPSYVDRIVVK